MHHPHPPSLHQQKLPNWHHKLIIQLQREMLALCANETLVAYPAAAHWLCLEKGWRVRAMKFPLTNGCDTKEAKRRAISAR